MMRTDYETPRSFFDALNKEFDFTLDVCATPETAKCERFFTVDDDGLKQDWTGERIWMNPPYGRGVNVYQWVEKAYGTPNCLAVCLLPASTDTKWFHDFCLKANEIRFVKDRLHFKGRANHGNIVVVFCSAIHGTPKVSSIGNGR